MVPVAAVEIVDGLHVPEMPLVELTGKAAATLFWQIEAMAAKTGVVSGTMVMSMLAVVAHSPAVGVKV